MTPNAACGLLAEPDRLRVYAAVVLGAGLPSEIADRAGTDVDTAIRALRRLHRGGLLSLVDGRYAADAAPFKEAVRVAAATEPPVAPLDPDPRRDAVLRAFIRDGRLVHMPVARAKLRMVLEHIVAGFEPGVRYPEREVNTILRAWTEDYVTLRRNLIDTVLLDRADGYYWRSGGPVEV
ncbi:hypothetical protein Lfu02_15760 [Longispora fulva]|uniref:DUF2087 domain-containing protein n=1 Tax=Longispora fulva TaxID=619741 RepID=A0A8J7KJH7_9ACTN|nr:DUF2087 domain-containing protein [Longispora fulva]MBG6140415.1 hypothetical protein [Longispora fulva]GIG57204.1 hypothetical protein Lfu02_15760 [Longispora fulva]